VFKVPDNIRDDTPDDIDNFKPIEHVGDKNYLAEWIINLGKLTLDKREAWE